MGVYKAFFNASIIFCSYKFFELFIFAIYDALYGFIMYVTHDDKMQK